MLPSRVDRMEGHTLLSFLTVTNSNDSSTGSLPRQLTGYRTPQGWSSRRLTALLRQLGASLLVTTCQAGKLVLVRDEGDHVVGELVHDARRGTG